MTKFIVGLIVLIIAGHACNSDFDALSQDVSAGKALQQMEERGWQGNTCVRG